MSHFPQNMSHFVPVWLSHTGTKWDMRGVVGRTKG